MLPASERLLLGPGPSLMSPRVMRALAAPMLSHLDPEFVDILDDTRERLADLFKAEPGAFTCAISGTGTSGMETAVANLVEPGTRVVCVVTGYFGDRLAQMCERYGAKVTRVDAEWGRACDPAEVERAVARVAPQIVAVVHAETSTGVLNPVEAIARSARQHDALVVVDAVTSLGGMPLDAAAWNLDVVYSCTQKCIGAPSGLSPLMFSSRALTRRVPCRSFYFDLSLIEDYWLRRKYHHTMCASLVYALHEALVAIGEEGLEARWRRHERHHAGFAAGLQAMGLSLLPPLAERLWTLNAVRVPENVREADVRREMLRVFNMEIGAGLGPLAGRVFRVGLMGASSTPSMVTLCLSALEQALTAQGRHLSPGAGASAAVAALA